MRTLAFKNPMYDLVIIGGGPAGAAAAVYAARKKITTALITETFGGQSIVSLDIQNWIGTPSISGIALAEQFENHVRAQEDIHVETGEWVSDVKKTDNGFTVKTKGDKIFETKAVLLVTGSHHRKLNIPGEKEFDGKGVAYCATCDAPLFKDKDVAVVGAGNAGLEAIVDLLPYAKSVTLIQRSDTIKGDPVTFEKLKNNEKVTVIMNAETTAILGDEFMTGAKYKDKESGEEKKLKLGGLFVEIGAVPSSDLVKDLVQLNDRGEIVVDHKTQASSLPGIWAAGDVSDVIYKQNNISAGDAIKAVLNINDYLRSRQ
ncbi:MAG: pyridine nucleotide-disulfide oxidoreductase [Candidatus Harrisonbacteria bacterium CG10_big_fil_rev_8_21_14_0_10_42_17]|uniref:Pyridine nucleotide-disulfide oxidoreductase n=1 Tax=Candidatus Harrisonbacteria bacterium CG10_big_fil_rev_8_21_14_0_10_42_17 TaxID=1974584 RepID=A0A2M6WHU5_9BACT|nr:MAG: pyridine nucleotide-disulfide oxidoreductase [Candidatus Harrisonbacteria bacterium CG10_big_fil_rev_8_21_14_0_10_42_17]